MDINERNELRLPGVCMDPKELRKKYLEMSKGLSKQLGLPAGFPVLTNDEGRIILAGRRWVLMDVESFPIYMIKTLANMVGERLAQEFIYWFGVAYGEKVAERFLKMGVTQDMLPLAIAAFTAVFTGWGIVEVIEYEPENGEAVVKIYNDFESESAIINGSKPTNNFMRGIIAGISSKVSGAKVYASAEYKDGYILVTVKKR